MNKGGSIVNWNHQAEQIFGWLKTEVIGKQLHDLIIPERFKESYNEGFRRFLANGESTILNMRRDIWGLRRDGHEFPAELSVTPVTIGNEMLYSAFVNDTQTA